MRIRVTLRNYRCFHESQPLVFDLQPGFTGIVGPNDVGKSSLLRFFYELRSLWEVVARYGNFINLLVGRPDTFNPRGVRDRLELFCNRNERDLVVTLEVDAVPEGGSDVVPLRKVSFTAGRDGPPEWRVLHGDGIPLSLDPKVELVDREGILHYGGARVLDLRPMKQAGAVLLDSIYLGPFRTAVGLGAQDYHDLAVGGSFIKAWHEWKAGTDKGRSRTIHRVTEDLRRIFSYGSLEIGASHDLTTLLVAKDGWSYRLEELGAGFAQFVYVLGTAAMRRPTYIFIDEPELHLHAPLQLDFLTRLASYASAGIVFATHSVGLARAAADRVLSMRTVDGVPVCRPLEHTSGYAEFLGELSFTSFRELGVDSVLLVEGVTEVRTLQQFLRLLRLDHRVVLLPLGGGQMIRGDVEPELAEVRRVAERVYVLIDSERNSPSAKLDPQRRAFLSTCGKLGFCAHVTDRRATENYFPERAVRAEMGSKYRALEPFERLRDTPLGWSKTHNWRIARHMSVEELIETDVGRFLRDQLGSAPASHAADWIEATMPGPAEPDAGAFGGMTVSQRAAPARPC